MIYSIPVLNTEKNRTCIAAYCHVNGYELRDFH